MKRKKRIGLLTLLFLFVASLLTATSFGYWNLSSEVSVTVSENTQNVATKVNQYTSDRAVCYLDDAPAVFYTSIEKALSVAKSGRTVYVIPNEDENVAVTPVYINKDCTVPSGVSLTLPYTGTTYFDQDARGTSNAHADSSTSGIKKYRRIQVIINEGVTLTVEGTLNIGGIQGGPSAGVSGATTGRYCEISMCANSKIECSGTINCFGYIKEFNNSNNGSQLIMNSGTLNSPFVIYDFKGGTATLGLANKNEVTPFCIFDFCNLQVKTRIYSNAVWKGRTLIYIGKNDAYYPTNESDKWITIVGNSSTNTAIVLSSGYIDFKYTSDTFGITSSDYKSGAITGIEIYGNAEIGRLKISIKVSVKSITIDTNVLFFPVSYRLYFVIKSGSTMNVNKMTKFMNGSSLLVEEGGALNVTNKLIFYRDFVDSLQKTSPYPSGKAPARFICNGTANVTGSGVLAGYLETESANGILNYQTTTYTVSSPECGGDPPPNYQLMLGIGTKSTKYSVTATGLISNGSSITKDANITKYNYSSIANPNGNGYAWLYPSLT